MEEKEKQNIKLRFGLSLKNILDHNKAVSIQNEKNGIDAPNLIKSYGKLATLSDIPKATIIRIASGKINMASSTLAVIVETLEITLSEFGRYFDAISEKDVDGYRKLIAENQKSRSSKKTKKPKPKAKKKSRK